MSTLVARMTPLAILMASACAGGGKADESLDASPETDADADADADTDADTDSDADSDTDSDTDSDADTDSATDTGGPDLAYGLLLHYPFDDGTASDASGNGLDGTLTGAVTFSATASGQAAYFSNPSGGAPATMYVELPDLTALIGDAYTVVVCYTSADGGQQNGRLFGNWSTSQSDAVFVDYNADGYSQAHSGVRSGGEAWSTRDLGKTPYLTTDSALHCQAVGIDTYTGTAFEILDGVRALETPFSGAAGLDQTVLGAAAAADGFGALLTAVDDLRIYDRRLSEDEVAELLASLL